MVKNAPVAQLDRASAFEAEGRGFESLRARHFVIWHSTDELGSAAEIGIFFRRISAALRVIGEFPPDMRPQTDRDRRGFAQ